VTTIIDFYIFGTEIMKETDPCMCKNGTRRAVRWTFHYEGTTTYYCNSPGTEDDSFLGYGAV
jgi:hypothetical protein